MQFGPRIPHGGKAMAIFGLIVIAIFWIGTTQRGYAELAEAQSSEFSKNVNLALALDVQFLPKPFTADVLLRELAGAVAGS